jgi:hypothetical protein
MTCDEIRAQIGTLEALHAVLGTIEDLRKPMPRLSQHPKRLTGRRSPSHSPSVAALTVFVFGVWLVIGPLFLAAVK